MPRKNPVKQKLIDTYIDLLFEKGCMDISITELTARAGVSRISFYRNYSSYDDLMVGVCTYIAKTISEYITPLLEIKNTQEMIEFYQKMPDVLKRLHSNANSISTVNMLYISLNFSQDIIDNELIDYSTRNKYLKVAEYFLLLSFASEWTRNTMNEEEQEEATKLLLDIIKKLKELEN